jgi:transposase
MTNSSSTPQQVTSLEEARSLLASQLQEIQKLQWENSQLKRQLYGPSSERQTEDRLSKEQILLSLFPPPSEPPATEQVLVPASQADKPVRQSRQPAARVLETVSRRLEPEDKVCAHCGKAKCEIGCERSERFEYVPARIIRHEILRPKLACPCGQSGVSIAALPPQLIDQGKAGASLVAHVVLS